jgi:glutaredoxin
MAVEVMLYTLSRCPWCHKAKKYFEDQGVPFHFLDVDTAALPDRERAEAVVKGQGAPLQYPAVFVNDLFAQGYEPERYGEMLEQAGWRPSA